MIAGLAVEFYRQRGKLLRESTASTHVVHAFDGDELDDFEERAGIIEFEGGEEREVAEMCASEAVLRSGRKPLPRERAGMRAPEGRIIRVSRDSADARGKGRN